MNMNLHKKILLDWLRHCAEQGEFCPTNDAICDRFGFANSPSAVRLMKVLEEDGVISVERLHKARVVTILATGETTARPATSKASKPKVDVPPPAPKWRMPAEIVAAAALDGRPLIPFAEALMMMGLDCWRDDRILELERVGTFFSPLPERTTA